MEGLDCFLVRRIERESYIRCEKIKYRRNLIVVLHNVPRYTEPQVEKMSKLKTTTTCAVIKMIDNVGNVISRYFYNDVLLDRVDYAVLDYNCSEMATIKLTLSYKDETIEEALDEGSKRSDSRMPKETL
jgi:hypothetical protein